jgi:hypothetical protein
MSFSALQLDRQTWLYFELTDSEDDFLSRPWPRRPKPAGFLGEEVPGDILAVYRPAAANLRIRAGKNRLAVNRAISAGFSSKRYRKGTCLVQLHPGKRLDLV